MHELEKRLLTGAAAPPPPAPADDAAPAPPARPYLRPDKASRYLLDTWGLSYTAGTLAKYRLTGEGPAWSRAGKRAVLYAPDELDRWVRSRLRRPAAPAPAEA